jgi:hypothetical protein
MSCPETCCADEYWCTRCGHMACSAHHEHGSPEQPYLCQETDDE